MKYLQCLDHNFLICGLNQLLKEVESILNTDSQLPQLLSYDTTFQLGDFNVSPLLCRQVIFKNSPVMPVLFLIHERKFQEVHQVFMQHVAKNLPSLVEGGKKLVPDEEVGICQVKNLNNAIIIIVQS